MHKVDLIYMFVKINDISKDDFYGYQKCTFVICNAYSLCKQYSLKKVKVGLS